MPAKKQMISAAAAKRVGGKLSVDWAMIDLDQLRRGLAEEFDRGVCGPRAKLQWAHRRESPDTP
jgi:hypothetical protein